MHWRQVADAGFTAVMAGPLVRSSYRAGRLWATAMEGWGRPIPEPLAHLAAAAGDRPARRRPNRRTTCRRLRGLHPLVRDDTSSISGSPLSVCPEPVGQTVERLVQVVGDDEIVPAPRAG